MESNRSKIQEPFPGNSSIPLKLREVLHEVGIKPDASRRIPWGDLPYALYEKNLYLSGLPVGLLFPSKHNPSPEDQAARLHLHLKWPFAGVENPLKLLQQACTSNTIAAMHRPPGRDVVFELIKEDGSRMDVGQWKAPRSLIQRSKLPSNSKVIAASGDPATIKSPIGGPQSNKVTGKPMSPASLSAPTSKAKTSIDVKMREKPPLRQKPSAVTTRIRSPSLEIISQPGAEIYPNSENVPLRFKIILKQAGVPESKEYPGRINWEVVPDKLWSTTQYITGIPASVILGTMDPTIKTIKAVRQKSFKMNLSKPDFQVIQKALDRDEIKLLRRPKNRDVVFEVITSDGPIDIGRWEGPTTTTSATLKSPSVPNPKVKLASRKTILDDSSDEQSIKTALLIEDSSDDSPIIIDAPSNSKPPRRKSISLKPSTNPFPHNTQVSLGLRRLFEEAGVAENPEKPGSILWSDVPHALWRNDRYITGLPRGLVLGDKTSETVTKQPWDPSSRWRTYDTHKLLEALQNGKIKLAPRPLNRNVVFEVFDTTGRSLDIGPWPEILQQSPVTSVPSSNNEMDTDDKSEGQGDLHSPVDFWQEVSDLNDQLAEMFIESGVKLPQHPTRDNAYKIVWSDLPKQLNDARVTLAGFPLRLLPYWKAQGKLNGKWVIVWKRETLDQVVELLENDGIGMENWTRGSKDVVQAIDEDDEYNFTYDDFVNAMNDDPEQLVVGGQILKSVKLDMYPKRKRRLSNEIYDDRVPKRRRTFPEVTAAAIDANAYDSQDPLTEHNMDTKEAIKKLPLVKPATEHPPMSGFDYYYTPPHDPELGVAELNTKYRHQKEIIKTIIAILIYHDIPCIAPEDEGLDFFLPWSNLPRLLAARMVCLVGWPSICAPVVQNNVVVVEFGPASWTDQQWNALDIALTNGDIDVKKTSAKHLFELVDLNNGRETSNVNFGRPWINTNWGVEADQPVTIFAKDVSIMDPIVEETDIESDEDEEMTDNA